MIVRQLRYLIGLSQTRHFARAAGLCQVSQPALSTGIRQLEKELGITIVRRGQRFQGFTPEGERLMVWARRMVADWEGLKEEASSSRARLQGTLRIGVIPTALAMAPRLIAPMRRAHPEVGLVVRSLPTQAILRQLEGFELDLAIVYHEPARAKPLRALPLYRERHVLLTPDPSPLGQRAGIGWAEAAALPLCLLTPDMQNRRIVDEAFRQAGATPRVVVETDSIVALSTFVREAGLFSVVPHRLFGADGSLDGVATVPLLPESVSAVELVALRAEPPSPIVGAAWALASSLVAAGGLEDGADKRRLSADPIFAVGTAHGGRRVKGGKPGAPR